MELLVERAAALDVGKDEVVACIRVPDPVGVGGGRGRRHQEVRTFPTFTSSLEALADWLQAEGVTQVVMEATGQYWKPIWYVLEERGFQQQLEPTLLQHLPAGLPVLAGRLHHHLGDALRLQPIGQRLQARGERRIGADLLAATSPTPTHPGRSGTRTGGHHLVLADVQPGAALVDHLHRRHLPRPLGGARRGQPIRRR